MQQKILQINYRLNVSTEEYRKLCESVAQPFAEVAGLRWKVWILNESEKEAGGIYLFDSESSLRAFLDGPLAAQVKSLPAIRDMSVKQFDVMDQVTAITRGPV
jgi:hypothetical protein